MTWTILTRFGRVHSATLFFKRFHPYSKCAMLLSSSSAAAAHSRPRSPYAVLQLRTSASTDDIKASFRRLAKKYHPDINKTIHRSKAEAIMAEIIEAYDQLMDKDFGGRVGDSRVALACEMYTIDELRMDRLHDVYSFKVIFVEDEVITGKKDGLINGTYKDTLPGGKDRAYNSASSKQSSEVPSTCSINAFPVIELEVHPDDSVSDVKRQIQNRYISEWGLENRRLDRDQVATGWELVHGHDGAVLSYHLFLHSYGIKNGDTIHAVVRKYHETEREASRC